MAESAGIRAGGRTQDGRGRSRGGVWLGWAATLALGLTVVGCNLKNKQKCQEALDTTRKSLKVDNMDLAQQWRTRAYKYCADTGELAKLDQDIATSRSAADTARRDKEAKKTHAQELMGLLVQWAGDHRATPEAAAQTVTCGPEDAADPNAKPAADAKDKDKKPRWCTRVRTVSGGFKLSVRYRENEVKVVDFATLLPAPMDCDALGANKVMIKGPPKTYCEITGGRLQGMQALITNQPDGTHVDVFTPEYVQRDATMQSLTR